MTRGRASQSSGSLTLLTLLVVVCILYFARSVLIPVALSILVAFLLGPLVVRFRNWGFGPIPAASIVVLFSLIIAGAVSFMMLTQLADLANRLPGYQENMQRKIQSLRDSGGGIVNKVSKIVYQVNEQLKPPSPESLGADPAEKPVPVEIKQQAFAPVEMVQKVIGSVLELLITAAVVVVFVLFMLIQRQDLRERVLRLAGAGRINVTTTVLDDAARRVSRYLLAQLVLNSSYGALAGIGLYFIGVPNPVLWAILTMLLRYVPYLGIWIAAAMPGALAFAIDPGWTQLVLILVLYFGIDMAMYNFLEPLLYGSSTGLSPVAVLVTTVFWTWLWGPVGLLLATPLTVCVVVLGRHVPRLQFLSVLLSDETPLTTDFRFFQRMLAKDLKEASEIARKAMAGRKLEEVYDQVFIPALTLAERERHHGKLDTSRFEFLIQNTRKLADELAQGTRDADGNGTGENDRKPKRPVYDCGVICIAARDEADELAAAMLVNVLTRRGITAEALSATLLAGEAVQQIEKSQYRIAVICCVPPHGHRKTRYLCRKLRTQWPGMSLIAAILTEGEVEQLRQRQPALGADELATSLAQTLTIVTSVASTKEECSTEPTVA